MTFILDFHFCHLVRTSWSARNTFRICRISINDYTRVFEHTSVFTQKQTQHCVSVRRQLESTSKFLLSLKFQIFRLISPIRRTFYAKPINCRFMGLHFPSTQNKNESHHIRTSTHSVSLEKIIMLLHLTSKVRFSFVFWRILECD